MGGCQNRQSGFRTISPAENGNLEFHPLIHHPRRRSIRSLMSFWEEIFLQKILAFRSFHIDQIMIKKMAHHIFLKNGGLEQGPPDQRFKAERKRGSRISFLFIRAKITYFGFLTRVDLERYERSPSKPYIRLSSNTTFHRIRYVSMRSSMASID